MQIFILTISPEMFEKPFGCGLFQKAVDKGVVKVDIRNIRDYTHDKHHTTDDTPYGGGAGMVMKPEPIFEAVETIKAELAQKEITDVVYVEVPKVGRVVKAGEAAAVVESVKAAFDI